MAVLGTLQGIGAVEWEGKSVSVRYHLVVTHGRGAIGGSGTLQHSDSLHDAFNAREQTLRLESGETMKILIDRMGSSGTHFLTSGIIPGGWEKMVR